jgi:hypothetical protein
MSYLDAVRFYVWVRLIALLPISSDVERRIDGQSTGPSTTGVRNTHRPTQPRKRYQVTSTMASKFRRSLRFFAWACDCIPHSPLPP